MKILLKEIRAKKKLSYRQLEIKTGIPIATLCRIENGKSQLTLEVAEQIAVGLNIKVTDLFDSQYK